MEYKIKHLDENEFLKNIVGMLKFAINNNGGKVDLIRCASFLGKSKNIISQFLDLLEKQDALTIKDKSEYYYNVDKISVDKASSVLHNPLYADISEMIEECELFQKALLEDDIEEILELIL